MNAETLYDLGRAARCAYPESASHDLLAELVMYPGSGLMALRALAEKRPDDEALANVLRLLPESLVDLPGGVPVEDHLSFWLGYCQATVTVTQARELGPDDLAEIGQALYGAHWQTEMSQALELGDTRRVRQWLSGKRPIPAGVWSELAARLRCRGMHALAVADKLER